MIVMAVCTNCGKDFDKIGTTCPYCHAKLGLTSVASKKTVKSFHGRYDDTNSGLMILSGFIPVIGFIEYAKDKEDYPLRASSAIKGAFVGTIIYLAIIALIIYLILFK